MLLSALDTFTLPMAKAEELRKNSLNPSDGTWGQALGARALFLTQVIASIVAVPLTLLAMIIAPPFTLCAQGKEKTGQLLQDLFSRELLHLTSIPTNFIAAFVPHFLKWDAPGGQISQLLYTPEPQNTPNNSRKKNTEQASQQPTDLEERVEKVTISPALKQPRNIHEFLSAPRQVSQPLQAMTWAQLQANMSNYKF